LAAIILLLSRTLILAPTIAQSFIFDLDSAAQGGSLGLYLTLHNIGANAIGTILWERSAIGDQYVPDLGYAAVAGVSLAAGAELSLDDNGIRSRYLRVTLTSALGTTCLVRIRGGAS
jgi:hypothetical protein